MQKHFIARKSPANAMGLLGAKLGKQGLRSVNNNEMQGEASIAFYLRFRTFALAEPCVPCPLYYTSTAANRRSTFASPRGPVQLQLHSANPHAVSVGERSKFEVWDLRFEIRDSRFEIRDQRSEIRD